VYGNDYSGLLITLLFSIKKTNPQADVSVYWQDMDDEVITPIRQTFFHYNFIKTNFQLYTHPIERVSQKTDLWQEAVANNYGKNVCILDSDTIVNQPLTQLFSLDFDILFSEYTLDFRYPMNTGVMFLKSINVLHQEFFHKWKEKTLEAFQSNEKKGEAIRRFGGVDQYTFSNLIHYKRGCKSYFYENNNAEKLVIKPFPHQQINQTEPIGTPQEATILHYKGGWQAMLIRAYPITKFSYQYKRLPMYQYYLRLYKEAYDYMSKKGHHIDYKRTGIKIPFYLNRSLEFNLISYFFYCIFERFYRFFYNRKRKILIKLLSFIMFRSITKIHK